MLCHVAQITFALPVADLVDLAEDAPERRRRTGAVVAARVAVELAGRPEGGRAALAREHFAQRELVVVAVQAVSHLVATQGGANVARHGSGGDAGGGENGGGDRQRLVRVGGREERRDAVPAGAIILKVGISQQRDRLQLGYNILSWPIFHASLP